MTGYLPRGVDHVRRAMKKGYRISLCPGCDGPRIHGKKRGVRCVGCGQFWDVIAWTMPTLKCDRCRRDIPQLHGRKERCERCVKTLRNLDRKRRVA